MNLPDTCFAVVYRPGPNWREQETGSQDEIQGHIDYQHGWLEKGVLLMGGPYIGTEGGMALFRIDSEDELQVLLAADPAVAAGIYQTTVHRWRIAVSSLEG